MGRVLMAGLHHLAVFHRPALSSAGTVGKMYGRRESRANNRNRWQGRMKTAGVFDALVNTGARLEDACWLEPGLGVASWRNCYDQTRYHKPGHHTLSVYLQGGEQTERLDGPGGHGGTGKVCIMPDHHRSEWLVREEFRFFHLYFTPAHLTRIAEEVCDKEGRHLQLVDKTFIDDPQAAGLVQRQLMQLEWQHGVDRLALSHGAWMLILHAYRHHTEEAPGLPPLRGGLAPVVIKRVQEYLQAHLADSVTLAELAQQAGLSEYHFARMFGQSLGCPPHRYLLGLRLKRAKQLLAGPEPLASIASQCGFSSQAHFGNRFREAFGLTPGQWRAQLSSSCHR